MAVNQNIDTAKESLNLSNSLFDILLLGDVRFDPMTLAPELGDRLGRFLEILLAQADRTDIRSG